MGEAPKIMHTHTWVSIRQLTPHWFLWAIAGEGMSCNFGTHAHHGFDELSFNVRNYEALGMYD